ncbi:hypothetical protein EKO04_005814 [Ascochyta lentis]|uniref:Kinesin light chain n=1 Tax=Ascochyta lentis TaxID=205686 RepID=A0A8H7J0V4_9PLEO|nr:hypothetical protein EKO04_005814 [Ascochyta lentis]
MRLLETIDGYTFKLTKDFLSDEKIPAYAILSHTWADQEVTFDDLIKDNKNGSSRIRASLHRLRSRPRKLGYDKIHFCAQQAKRDGLRYFWVDTCCIDKKNLTELQRAINSMFRWYRDATKCYVYLSDVSNADPQGGNGSSAWLSAFISSRWFTRGWTLQELLAPSVVEFFSKEGVYLGDRLELKQHIHNITKIPLLALSGASLVEFSVDERLSWVEARHTTCEEDKAYSMLGIFGIHLPLIYGEGYENAFERLQGKIKESQGGVINQGAKLKRIPLSTVPFKRDDDFVTRDSLAAIRQVCAKPAARAALVGLGGVGKSQIAVEYAYQVQEESPLPWVFWVHAETQARFREGYRTIAEAIRMDGWNDLDVDYMRLVRTWLCDESNGRWVMVVDNADDASVFFQTQDCATSSSDALWTEPLINFLPQRSLGSILITSRSCDVAYRLTGAETSIIKVGPMNESDAFALLQKKFILPIKKDEATTLISALDYMPLALTQAAAFINRRGTRMSISQYVKKFRKSDRDRAYLLEYHMSDSRRDGEASNSIIATWQISFEYIRKQTPSAARLLSLMSFFDRQNIPETLLHDRYGESNKEANFEDDIYTLISFSLVRPSADGGSFDMHRLVQLSMKLWLEQSNELVYWKELYVTLMDESYPMGQPENWLVCQALFPHAEAALNNIPVDADALERWASLSINMSWYLSVIGDHNKAHKLAIDSFDVREILLGVDNPLTLDTLNSLALTLHRLGRYDEAKALHLKALEAKKRTLGADDRDTLCSMVNLASLYIVECQWADAEKLLTEVLDTSRMALGPEHPFTLDALIILANTYRDQSRWAEAVEIELQMLQIRETQLGSDHPETLIVKSNLAFSYRGQGLLKEAEEIQLQILESCRARPVAEIDLLSFKTHLALTYVAQDRLEEAEKLQLQILDTSRAKLGMDHLTTMKHMANLASTYWKQGRLKEAQELDMQTLELRKAKLGDQHLSTLDSKLSLAVTYRFQGLLDKAEQLETEVIEVHTRKLGKTHPLTLHSQSSLASTYRDQGRLSEAEALETFVLQKRTGALGPDHVDTLRGMHNLAVTYKKQGRAVEALGLMEKCYEAYRRVLGSEHWNTVGCRDALEKWRLQSEQAREPGVVG